jgi:hypothetical protein
LAGSRAEIAEENSCQFWKARNRGAEVEIAQNGKASGALTPKPLD